MEGGARELISLLEPCGFQESTCGYCGEPGKRSVSEGSATYGMIAHQLSARVYGLMLDYGWRRSGTYCYKPVNATTCCPHITIRCAAKDFRASKSQRQLLNRFVRRIKGQGSLKGGVASSIDGADQLMEPGPSTRLAAAVELSPRQNAADATLDVLRLPHAPRPVDGKGKGRDNTLFSVLDSFADVEHEGSRFSIRTEPSSFTKEKFALYKQYQEQIHNDDHVTERGFKRFLCDAPIAKAGPGLAYGSYHQLYYLDNELVAIGVIDILPICVSSVYFIWHPGYADLSLGKLGALREVALVQQLSKVLPQLRYYYLGYYIHSCPKMRYKAEYRPCDLADMVDYTWHDMEVCKPLLDQHKRALFSKSAIDKYGQALESTEDDDDDDDKRPTPVGWLNAYDLDHSLLSAALVWSNSKIQPLLRTSLYKDVDARETACEALAALGETLGPQVVLAIS